MKNIIIAFISVILAALAIGLILVKNPPKDRAPNVRSISPSALPAKTFHSSPRDYNRFAVETYQKIARENDERNAVFSPFGLSMALETLYAGAKGDTARSLETLLHLPQGDSGEPQNPALFEYVALKEEYPDLWSNPPIFLFGNSIWYSKKLTLNRDYERKMNRDFFLEAFPVDFTSGGSSLAMQMEQWCDRTTQGLIPSLDPHISKDMAFCLLSTLYFKAHWDYKFQTGKTKDAPFTLADGKTVTASTMRDEHGFPYMENEELRALEMPYFSRFSVSDFSMVFVLPKAVDGIHSLEEKLTTEFLDTLMREMKVRGLEVSIPKFRLEQENDLLAIFRGHTLFGDDADFSGMFTTPPVIVGKKGVWAVQKIILGIDEHGTETAVFTEIGYASLGSEPPKFIADHPFLFLVRERNSGTILFLGRVMDPTRN